MPSFLLKLITLLLVGTLFLEKNTFTLKAQEASLPTEWLTLLLSEQYHLTFSDFQTLNATKKQERINILIQALENKQFWLIRQRAAEALGKIGKEAKNAIPFLLDRIQDRHGYVCCAAIWALGEMRENASSAVPALIPLLRSKDFIVPSKVAEALGKIGGSAKTAIPALIQALSYEYQDVQIAVIKTLGKFRAKEAIPALIQQLKSSNPLILEHIVEVLGKLKAEEAIPELIALQKTSSLEMRLKILDTLSKFEQKEVLYPLFISLLEHSNKDFRYKVANILGRKEWEREKIIPVLKESLKDKAPIIRRRAIYTLNIIKATELIPEFLKLAATDPDKYVQISAIQILASLNATESLPVLIAITKNHSNKKIRQVAQKAVKKLSQ